MKIPVLHRLRITEKSIPALFAVLVGLAYGLLLFQTGFYWDDWPFAWAAHFVGPGSFIGSFMRVRPFLGPIFWLTTTFLPETPLAWQAFALVIRFLLTLAAWWAFRQIWPGRSWQTLLAALCFLVYPGYSQHWVAFTHINQELIPLLFYILSFGITGLVLRSDIKRRRRTTLGLLLLALGVFPTEYFLSLEPLRFLFILSMISEQENGLKARLWRSLKVWLPYLAAWGLNALWLFVYYRSGIYANYDVRVGQIAPSLGGILLNLFKHLLITFFQAGLLAWGQLPLLAVKTLSAPSTWIALGVAGLVFSLLMLYFRQLERSQPFSAVPNWALQATLIGLTGLLLGRLPSWAAGLPLTLQSSFDRFTVSMFIGASLFCAGLLTLIFRQKSAWMLVSALVIALGVGQQFYNANIFRRDWERQRNLYWQLAWRVPALQPGTILLTDEVEIDYETDYSLTAPLNWMYAPDLQSLRLPYLVLGVGERSERLPLLEPGQAFEFAYRPARFYGNTSQVVAFIAPPAACLRILDPRYDNAATFGRPSPVLRQITQLSNPELILVDAPGPAMPASVFGPEPPHDWCYYYARAELARQRGDWEMVGQLGDEALEHGFRPHAPTEWLPFIEGYALTGQMDKAEKLSRLALDPPPMHKGVCALWLRVAEKQPLREGLLRELGCQ